LVLRHHDDRAGVLASAAGVIFRQKQRVSILREKYRKSANVT
jgi:hypothetical protein